MTNTDPVQWKTDPTIHFAAQHANQRRDNIDHFVVEHEDRPDDLAFVPRDPDGDVPTRWIRINADDALSLDNWR